MKLDLFERFVGLSYKGVFLSIKEKKRRYLAKTDEGWDVKPHLFFYFSNMQNRGNIWFYVPIYNLSKDYFVISIKMVLDELQQIYCNNPPMEYTKGNFPLLPKQVYDALVYGEYKNEKLLNCEVINGLIKNNETYNKQSLKKLW